MGISIRIALNDGLYLKDPQDSDLGRKLIENSIILIHELGFESFTFKKLAIKVDSTEASIYRYFKNKHYLLLYLVSWYWEWVQFLIELNTMNVSDARRKLGIIIHSFISASKENHMVEYVNESILHQIVIVEGGKAYFDHDVDEMNNKGFFLSYKSLVNRVSDVISELNPGFRYPHALATSLFEMSNNHIYYAEHLPLLTDLHEGDADNIDLFVENMLTYFADRLLAK